MRSAAEPAATFRVIDGRRYSIPGDYALVEAYPSAELDEGDLVADVKQHLAPYKAPKRVLFVDTIGRAPNGKVDYKQCRAEALAQLRA